MNQLNRRKLVLGSLLLGICAGASSQGQAQSGSGTKLILLGTKGGPRVDGERSNPSTLITIDGTPYLIDCGYGTARQLVRAGVALQNMRHIFFTHMHSDHNLDYGGVVYGAWATGLKSVVDVYGMPPLKEMTEAFMQMMRFDIDTRIADEGRPDLRKLVAVHEFDRPGVILENAQVKVSAARVVHPPIEQAYAYRFDTRDRSIVISGDTNYSTALIELARGADVLVHEVMYLPAVDALAKRVANGATLKEHLLASHTITEDLGKVAAAAGVKKLVLSHFVPGDVPSITDEMWTQDVRKHFKGEIVVGRDLMVI
jgi:ribonuclease BN (tRNA processing enzyme)